VTTDLTALAQFVLVPGGVAPVGSTEAEIEAVVDEWAPRLPFTPEQLRFWLLKEVPCHPVTIAPVYVMRYPVAAGLDRDRPRAGVGIADDQPASFRRWSEAAGFAERISRVSALPFRLPTEPEWEWAARGESRWHYPWGPSFDSSRCNTAESGVAGRTPVTAHPAGASAFGVEDLVGNVEEWTSTGYQAYPGGTVIDDDIYVGEGAGYPVAKGGSYLGTAELARIARRHGWTSDHGAYGARLVIAADAVGSGAQAQDALLEALQIA
jgi:formylglycine-generating enzyme required for sulfatase activity